MRVRARPVFGRRSRPAPATLAPMAEQEREQDGPSRETPSLEAPSLKAPSLKAPSLKTPSLKALGLPRRRRRAHPASPAAAGPRAPEQIPAQATEPPYRQEDPPGRSLALQGGTAALLVGLVVGLAAVALTAGGSELCRATRGTASCGGAGWLLLGAILVVSVLLGAVLLRRCGVAEPGSTSTLAVAVLAVVALLAATEDLPGRLAVVLVPLLGGAAFALSHRVTAASRPEDGDGPGG